MAAGRLDRELERYLVRGERTVVVLRQHWFSQIKPISAFVGLLFFATFVEAEAPRTQMGANLANFVWLLALGGFIYLLWRYLNWRHDWFVATDKRLLLFYGFIRRKVAMMPNMKVTDMTFERSITGRLIGYGTFILESAGQSQALSRVEYVPNATEHYQAICDTLFGTEDAARDPDDGWAEDEDDEGNDDGGPDGPGRAPGPGSGPDDWDSGWRDEYDDPHGWRDHFTREGRGTHADGIRNPVTDRHAPAPPHETLYQSSDLLHASRLEDTGEIPVIRPRGNRRPGRKGN
ncbi:hypothetical protein N802_05855 [Knoellia sinensis KCTC 19936]|uniref:YdbS-like PH domain-containing protein n=1 Tax=Knoellia sinensis KCTC 19936 TaxID=1385520 RepID=A0A0A0J5N1_9MICO|nr:PH domain-containing protein [Knoellia sinensis]KGN30921.1 hypothetical protein N802_05855 [Knoellia sinensis KCTC 19936]